MKLKRTLSDIERRRMAVGLTRSGLARKLGVTRQAVRSWETGRTRPHPQYVPRLAEIFGITPLEVTRLIVPDDAPAKQAESAPDPPDAA